MYVTTALVLVPGVRIAALRTVALTGLPTVIGVFTATRDFRKSWLIRSEQWGDTISLSLMVFVTCWVAWYTLMSYGWPRYLFPPLFVGSIFVGLLMAELTRAEDPRDAGPPAMAEPVTMRYHGTGGILLKVAFAGVVLLSLLTLCAVFVSTPRSSMMSVIDFVNSSSSANSLIETYEMELLFLMDRRYHYPPEEIQVRLNQRTYGGQAIELNYDPLKADPDYLIIGPHGTLWHLYDRVIEAGHFRLLKDYSRYRVYGRVR